MDFSSSRGSFVKPCFFLLSDIIWYLLPFDWNVRYGSIPKKEYLPIVSPPSTLSSRNEYLLLLLSFINAETGVSRSASISLYTGITRPYFAIFMNFFLSG